MTQSTDLLFVPQVASQHVLAYFERKMGLAKLAAYDTTLKGAPGETVTFPYWKKMGAAQKPAEDEGLEVDKLADDKFAVTVYEIAKAAGWSDKAARKSGAGKTPAEVREHFRQEAYRQIGELIAEEVDKDLIALLSNAANYTVGFTASDAAHKLTVGTLFDLKTIAFGDKHSQANAVAMHSLCYSTLMKDAGTGFLKADATHPLYGAPGYEGLLLGQALFVLDSMPEVEAVGGKKAFAAYSFKADPFGISVAQDLNPEEDRDILMRQNVVTSTMWLGMTGLHGKVSAEDKRIARGTFATDVNA